MHSNGHAARALMTLNEVMSCAADSSKGRKFSSTWDERELWALEDAVPRYAIESGRHVLWDRLARDVPELVMRSAYELRACWLDPPVTLQKGNLKDAPVECPPRLEQWERLEDGSVRGVLYGVLGVRDGCVRATVAAIPAAAGSVAEAEQWCVRTRDGDVFQLGHELRASTGALGSEQSDNSVASSAGKADAMVMSTVIATAATFATPAMLLALLAGGALLATGGHVHIPHVDVNIFVV